MGTLSTLIIRTALLMFTLVNITAQSQSDPVWGVLFGGTYNYHDASFTRLGTYPSCCPSFTSGDGVAIHGGAFYRFGISKLLALEGRIVAGGDHGTFLYNENSVVADLRDTLRVVRATFEHRLESSIVSVGIEPMASISIVKGLDLVAGPRLSLNIIQQFEQSETLTQPADYGAYLGADRTWVSTSAEIPNASSIRIALLGGLRFRLPQKPTSAVGLGFELLYAHGLQNVTTDNPWRVHQLRLSASLSFGIRKAEKPPLDTCFDCPRAIARTIPDAPVTNKRDTIKPNPYVSPPAERSSRIEIAAIDNGDTTTGAITVYERNRRIIILHPMLGHVYFDEGQSILPLRYQQSIAKSFRDTLHLTPLEALQGELGIIAQRMKMHPDAWLSITGTTSTTQRDDGLRLARARAEEVRSVMNKLGVYDDRLRVSARVYPERPTTFADSATQLLAQEENRRVELSSNNPAILAPVKLGTVQKLHYPAGLVIKTAVEASADSSQYTVVVRRGSDVVASRMVQPTEGEGVLTLDLQQDLHESSGDSLLVELTTNRGGRPIIMGQRRVPIKQDEQEFTQTSRSGDLEIERYGLILFEFDEAKISKQHERQLQFIRSRIRENTTVTVIGATDQIGSQTYNRELSMKRAKEVARRLGVSGAVVVGNGEDSPSLPNELPEGRASNRTVIIELATPVK